jgi:hypothetical protein
VPVLDVRSTFPSLIRRNIGINLECNENADEGALREPNCKVDSASPGIYGPSWLKNNADGYFPKNGSWPWEWDVNEYFGYTDEWIREGGKGAGWQSMKC